MSCQGTISRGIRAPIIREGDDLVKITADCVCNASKEDGFELQDKDVVAVTEAVLARSQGNQPERPVKIGNDVWIGDSVIILPGSVIGDGSIIGGGCVVRGEIPPYSVAIGNPATVVKNRKQN